MENKSFQPPPPLTFNNMKKIKEEISKIVELSRSSAQTIIDEERLNKHLEHKIYNMLNHIKINVGGNARFFKIVKKLQADLKWEDTENEKVVQ